MPNNNEGIKTTVGVKGDKQYKDALAQISRQLTVLNTDMKASQSAFGGQAETMAGMQDKLEKLNAIYEAQAQKVELIREQLEKAKAEYGDNSKQADELQIALNRATAQMNSTGNQIEATEGDLDKLRDAQAALGDEVINGNTTLKEAEQAMKDAGSGAEDLADAAGDAGDAAGDVGDAADDAADGVGGFGKALMDAAGTAGGAFKAGVEAVLGAMAAVGRAAAEALGEAFGMAQDAGKYADDLLTLSTQIGVDTDRLQQWGYASNFIDTSVETITGSLTKLTKNMASAQGGSESAQAAFTRLGVSWTDFNGQLRDSEDVFWDAIDALGQIENPTERDALAMELFGKSAKELNPLIEAGSDAWRDMGKEAEAMGTVFSKENLDKMGSFDDSMQRMNATGQALANSIGLVVIPAFQPLVDAASESMGKVAKALQEGASPEEIETLLEEVLGSFEAAIEDVGKMIEDSLPVITEVVGRVLGSLSEALPGLLEAILPGVITLVEGIGNALAENAGPLAELAASVMTALAKALVAALPKIVEKIPEIFGGIWEALTGADWPGLGGEILGMVADGLSGFGQRVKELMTDGRDEAAKVDWDNVKANLEGVAATLVNLAPAAAAAGLEGAYGLISGLNWQGLGETVGGVVNVLTDLAGEAIAAPLEAAYGFISGLDWSALGDTIADGLSRGFGLLAGVGDVALGLGESVVGAGKQGVGALKDWIASWRKDESVANEASEVGAQVITDLAAGVTEQVPTLETTAEEAADALLEAIKGVLTEKALKGIGLQLDADLGKGIEDGKGDVLVVITAMADDAFDALQREVAGLGFDSIGYNMSAGIAQGVTDGSWMIENAARSAALTAYEAASAALVINSPSKKGDYLGEMFDMGFAGGLRDNADEIERAMDFLNDVAVRGAEDVNVNPGGGWQARGAAQGALYEPDYNRIRGIIVEAIEETGVGDMVMYMDREVVGQTLEPVTSRATRWRQSQSVKGRTARLMMG